MHYQVSWQYSLNIYLKKFVLIHSIYKYILNAFDIIFTGTSGLIPVGFFFDGGPKYSFGCSVCFNDMISSSGKQILNLISLAVLSSSD